MLRIYYKLNHLKAILAKLCFRSKNLFLDFVQLWLNILPIMQSTTVYTNKTFLYVCELTVHRKIAKQTLYEQITKPTHYNCNECTNTCSQLFLRHITMIMVPCGICAKLQSN